MITIKIQSNKDGTYIPIPNNYDISKGTEMIIYQDKNKNINLVHKIDNPFESDIPFEKDDVSFWEQLSKDEISR